MSRHELKSSLIVPTTKERHVSILVIGGLKNAHNVCCNVRQAQDSLGRDGKIFIPLTLFVNLYQKVMLCRRN